MGATHDQTNGRHDEAIGKASRASVKPPGPIASIGRRDPGIEGHAPKSIGDAQSPPGRRDEAAAAANRKSLIDVRS